MKERMSVLMKFETKLNTII